MVRSGVRSQQIRLTGLFQGNGTQNVETHVDGRHGLDRVRTNFAGHRVKVVQYIKVYRLGVTP